MEKIWQFFENMNEYVYVTDMENDELIYMNKKTRNLYGFHSVEEIRGRKCYEVLQKSGAPCSMCNNSKLQEGYFEEWRHYNPIIGKYFMLKDTVIVDKEKNKRYRVELAFDISMEQIQDGMIKNYQNIETFANEGLRLALQEPSPEGSIEVILEYLGKALNGERTYIFEKNEQNGDDNTYEWVAEGVTPEKDNLQNVPPEVCANWYQNFEEGKNIVIDKLEKIKQDDPLQYENLKRQNIHSLVVVPLYDERKVIAFYGVDNPPIASLEYTSDILQIMGHFLVSCMKRRNLIRELRNMSYKDQLTGLGNRFAMEQYTKGVHKEQSIGVVYCDITGLKNVNDTMGHKEGDKLIIRACTALKDVFLEYGVFRIGGDELLALCAGISEKMLDEKVRDLRDNMKKQNVTIAVGAIWRGDTNTNLDNLLQESEKRMYKEKAEYYKKMGIERRK